MKKDISWNKIKSETKSIWAGEIDPFPYNTTQPSTVNSVAFNYKNIEEWVSVAKGDKKGHSVAKKQMKGYGGVLSFSVKDQNAIPSFISNLKFAHAAAHLGSLDTVVGPPKTTSHVENTPEERKKLGIPENLIRCSVGIEHIDDIKNDFDQALNKL